MAFALGALSLSHILFLLLLLLTTSIPTKSTSISVPNESLPASPALKPVAPRELGGVLLNETLQRRRRLGSFQICALCTCCGGPRGLCIPSPCCYAINCNIPNRPFGYCSFTPKTCNCLGCHL